MVLTIIPRFTTMDEFKDFGSPMESVFDMFDEQTNFHPYILLRRPKPQNHTNCPRRRSLHKKSDDSLVKRNDEVVHSDNFNVQLDLPEFKPEEISVKIDNDNVLSIEARHEGKGGESGYVFRHYMKKYMVPDGFDLEKMTSKFTTAGSLSITAPKLAPIENDREEDWKNIPIEHS